MRAARDSDAQQSLLHSQPLHMALMAITYTPPWNEWQGCFPGKLLSLPIWLNYRCFERLKQISKMSTAITATKHEKSLAALQLREKRVCCCSQSWKRSTWLLRQRIQVNPISLGNFCLALSLPFRLVLKLFHWTFGWSPPPMCCFPIREQAAVFPRPDTSDSRQIRQLPEQGGEPSWLEVTLQLSYTNRPKLLLFFQSDDACILFSCFHHLHVSNDKVKTKEKNTGKEKKKQTNKNQMRRKASLKNTFPMPAAIRLLITGGSLKPCSARRKKQSPKLTINELTCSKTLLGAVTFRQRKLFSQLLHPHYLHHMPLSWPHEATDRRPMRLPR